MPDRLTQVVASEPSLGTWKYHQSTHAAYLFSQLTVIGTWYTVTFAGIPAGTAAICCTVQTSGVAIGSVYWRPYNNGDTVANSIHRGIALNTGAYGKGFAMVKVDSSGRCDFGTDAVLTIVVGDAVFYSC
jgi:hypothetical protein